MLFAAARQPHATSRSSEARDYRDRPGNVREILGRVRPRARPDRRRAQGRSPSRRPPTSSSPTCAPTPTGAMYAPVTGFYSLIYGATGLERAENDILAGNDDRLIVDRIAQLLSRARAQGRDRRVDHQRARPAGRVRGAQGQAGCGRRDRPVDRRDPRHGLQPVVRPEPAQLTTAPRSRKAYDQLSNDPDEPLLNRTISQTYPPGSTFKLVTAAAALSTGRYTLDSVVPAPRSPGSPTPPRRSRNFGGRPARRTTR